MIVSERLLQLVAHLQSDEAAVDGRRGRRVLLKYVREISGAQVAVFFAVDRESQSLVLLAQSGRRPPSTGLDNAVQRLAAKRISIHGLFGSVLLTQGLLHISDLSADPRTLPEEQRWGWRGGHVILSAVGGDHQQSGQQGVLVVCFAPEDKRRRTGGGRSGALIAEQEGDLQLCIMLLASYLSQEDKPLRRSRNGYLQGAPLWDERQSSGIALPEMMYSLSELYETGLIIGTTVSQVSSLSEAPHEVYQHILARLRRVVRSQGACLLLYQPSQGRFVLGAAQGDELPCTMIADSIDGAALEQSAMRGPGETLSTIQISGNTLLLVTLSCEGVLIGVIALSIAHADVLLDERGLLLSYMGNMAALVLRSYALRISEQQAAIDRERSRIARDLHDGAGQRIAHVLHKLEFIQYVLEKQPQQLQLVLSEIKRAQNNLEASLYELRQGIASLLPAQLEERGFATALRGLLDEYLLNEPGLEISYDSDALHLPPSMLEVPIFRFIQEALSNIRKHAHATHVAIHFRVLSGLLVVEVSDNGIGIQPEHGRIGVGVSGAGGQHIGLRSMRERVQEVGGSWELQSRPGEGTTVKACFPLSPAATMLTSREREVLRLLVDGLTNRDIAQRLSVSIETVKSHIHHIMQKMQVKDRTQAAVVATRQRWL